MRWNQRYGFLLLQQELVRFLVAAAVLRPPLVPQHALPVLQHDASSLYGIAARDYCVLLPPEKSVCVGPSDGTDEISVGDSNLHRVVVTPFILENWLPLLDLPDTLRNLLRRSNMLRTHLWQVIERDSPSWLTLRHSMFRWLGLSTIDLPLLLGGTTLVEFANGNDMLFSAPEAPRSLTLNCRWPS